MKRSDVSVPTTEVNTPKQRQLTEHFCALNRILENVKFLFAFRMWIVNRVATVSRLKWHFRN